MYLRWRLRAWAGRLGNYDLALPLICIGHAMESFPPSLKHHRSTCEEEVCISKGWTQQEEGAGLGDAPALGQGRTEVAHDLDLGEGVGRGCPSVGEGRVWVWRLGCVKECPTVTRRVNVSLCDDFTRVLG